MVTFAFVVMLLVPTFGGQVVVTFSAETLDGCRRLQRVVTREMDKMTMRYELSRECAELVTAKEEK